MADTWTDGSVVAQGSVSSAGSTGQLAWDASPTPGVADYAVFRRDDHTGGTFDPTVDTPIADGVEDLAYDDEGLGVGDYEWQVFGRIDEGDWQAEVLALSTAVYGQRDDYVAPSGGSVVTVPPGTYNPNTLVQAEDPGTVFVFEEGLHRWTDRVQPKTGQEFHGEPDAIINGSKDISGQTWTQDGSTWWTSHALAFPPGSDAGCLAGYEGVCRDRNAVFLDHVPLRQRPNLNDVDADSFFVDHDNDRIYIGTDPTGRLVEVAVAPSAFNGADVPDWEQRTDVVLKNLVLEKFGTAIQAGTVHAEASRRWLVENCTIRLNYGGAVRISGNGGTVRGCQLKDNGQNGATGSNTPTPPRDYENMTRDLTYEHNEFTGNGYWAGVSSGFEAGSSKWLFTTDLIVRRNWVHANKNGLWTDFENYRVLIEENLVENNDREGIFNERNWDTIIRRNILDGNGTETPHINNAPWGAAILSVNAERAQIYSNICGSRQPNRRGIMIERAGHGGKARFDTLNDGIHTEDLLIRDNEVHLWPVGNGQNGGANTNADPDLWDDELRRLRWRQNVYYRRDGAGDNSFNHQGANPPSPGSASWSQWQSVDQDVAVIEDSMFEGGSGGDWGYEDGEGGQVTYVAGTIEVA